MVRRFLILILALSLVGCSGASMPPPEVVAAHIIGKTVNGAIDELAAVERAEGMAEIHDSKTADEARERIAEVEKRWEPIWFAVESFREAHGAYADALESGAKAPESLVPALRSTYCLVRVEARESVILPDFPGEPCQ